MIRRALAFTLLLLGVYLLVWDKVDDVCHRRRRSYCPVSARSRRTCPCRAGAQFEHGVCCVGACPGQEGQVHAHEVWFLHQAGPVLREGHAQQVRARWQWPEAVLPQEQRLSPLEVTRCGARLNWEHYRPGVFS